MRFLSVNGESPAVTFKEGLLRGLAPDGSLYVPERIPRLPAPFIDGSAGASLHEIGVEVAASYIDEIPRADLAGIVERAWTFPIPLVRLAPGVFLLELFHGPTLAFKDVGARFMAETLSYFLSREGRRVTIIVATSGDTGSAVAHGFLNVPNITVYVLYPSGMISPLQEQQMTTLGGNIHAVEVAGTFDDCQRLVKRSFRDPDILQAHELTTANSINLGRLIPQVAYYVWALEQWQRLKERTEEFPTVVVPSGNFGNLTAAAYAKGMGVRIGKLVAATNINDVVPQYLASGVFTPRPSSQTFSNAMDVGDPSNFSRLLMLYGGDLAHIRREIHAFSIDEDETLDEIDRVYRSTGLIIDPHTAVGVAAVWKDAAVASLPQDETTEGREGDFIVVSTAHPAKFPGVIEEALALRIPLPETLSAAMVRPKQSTPIGASFEEWKELLLASSR